MCETRVREVRKWKTVKSVFPVQTFGKQGAWCLRESRVLIQKARIRTGGDEVFRMSEHDLSPVNECWR